MPPVTLSQQQFAGTGAAKGGGTYKQYLKFIARNRPIRQRQKQQREAARSDPYRPWSEQEISSHASHDVMPGITSAATALTEALLGRATRSTNEINARTRAIQAALAPYAGSARSAYGDAAGRQQGLGDAMRSAIQGTGQAVSADLAGKLAGIQAPGEAVQQFAGGAAQTGQAAGAAAGALSSADLERLKGEGAAASQYAGAFPRIAQLAGEKERRGILGDAAQTLAEKLGDLYAQQPGQLREAENYYRGLEQNKAKEKYGRQQDAYERRQDLVKQRRDAAKDAALERYRGGQLEMSYGRLGQGQQRIDQGYARMDQSARQWAATHGLSVRRVELAEEKLRRGTTGEKGGYTGSQVIQLRKRAGQIAGKAWDGIPTKQKDPETGETVTGRVHMTYQEAMKAGLAQGIPLSVMQTALNSYWSKPGQAASWEKPGSGQGRPRQPFQARHPKAQAASSGGGDLRDVLQQAGFRGDALNTAYAVMMAESGGRPTAYNPNVNTGDQSYGLFQINMLGNMGPARRRQYGLSSNDDLYDPLTNARIAYRMSGGGRNWSPWSAYKSGAYRRYL